jgi:hypothetical protein
VPEHLPQSPIAQPLQPAGSLRLDQATYLGHHFVDRLKPQNAPAGNFSCVNGF